MTDEQIVALEALPSEQLQAIFVSAMQTARLLGGGGDFPEGVPGMLRETIAKAPAHGRATLVLTALALLTTYAARPVPTTSEKVFAP